jgi:hypothetical protein
MQPSQMYALAYLERADDDRRRAAERRQFDVTRQTTHARLRRRVLASLVRVPAAEGR